MIKTPTLAILLDNSDRTIQRWKAENRPIINLLDKYFNTEEIKEFLETGKIQKQEMIKDLSLNDLKNMKEFQKQLILDEISRTEEKLENLKKQLEE